MIGAASKKENIRKGQKRKYYYQSSDESDTEIEISNESGSDQDYLGEESNHNDDGNRYRYTRLHTKKCTLSNLLQDMFRVSIMKGFLRHECSSALREFPSFYTNCEHFTEVPPRSTYFYE